MVLLRSNVWVDWSASPPAKISGTFTNHCNTDHDVRCLSDVGSRATRQMTVRKDRRNFEIMFNDEILEMEAHLRGCLNKQEVIRAVIIPWWLEQYRKTHKLRTVIV